MFEEHPNAIQCLTKPPNENLGRTIRFRDQDTNRWRRGSLLAVGLGPRGIRGGGGQSIHGIFVEATCGEDMQWVAWDRFEFLED